MAVIFLAVLLILATVSKAEHLRATNTSFVGNPKTVLVPVSKDSDFENNVMYRDWIEGYYTTRRSYFRAYMAVYDEVNYPKYKDIWQDKSGHIVINGRGVLWIGFGRPARQIEFALKYQEQGRKKKEKNKPLIRSFLVDAETVIEISRRAIEERWRSRELDTNVDQSKSPNQFGLDSVSTELLRQNALSGSMVTYYLEKTSQTHASWGLVRSYNLLDQRVKKYNLNRVFPTKKGEWEAETLFSIKEDVISLETIFNPDDAEKRSAVYKGYLVKRQVLLNLIDEIMDFYKRGGKPYNILRSNFEKYVVNNNRIIKTFRLGEDVTEQALDSIEKSLLDNINKAKPSKGADFNLWERFSHSVNQIKTFTTYIGTEVMIGDPRYIIKEWQIFKNYRAFSVPGTQSLIPNMQLAQESTNIVLRMSYNHEETPAHVCYFIKHNFMGQRVDRLQLVSPLYHVTELLTYAKRVSDCVEGDDPHYLEKPLLATVVEIYGHDSHEYRFYPDAQVGWSVNDKGTMLLFHGGLAENLRIKGVVRNVDDILCRTKLQKEDPQLLQRIDHMKQTHGDGLIIVPQKYIQWPKCNKPIAC